MRLILEILRYDCVTKVSVCKNVHSSGKYKLDYCCANTLIIVQVHPFHVVELFFITHLLFAGELFAQILLGCGFGCGSVWLPPFRGKTELHSEPVWIYLMVLQTNLLSLMTRAARYITGVTQRNSFRWFDGEIIAWISGLLTDTYRGRNYHTKW